MIKLALHIKAMGEAGMTPDDLAQVQLIRYGDEYQFNLRETFGDDRAGVIVNCINLSSDPQSSYQKCIEKRKVSTNQFNDNSIRRIS